MMLPRRPAIPLLLAAALAILQATAGAAQVGRLLPTDDAARNPDLFAFRAQLQTAVARHDAAAVLEMVNPQIRTTFGDENGMAAFRKQWRPEAADSPLWAELGTLLALGGSFQDADNFVAPYVFSRWPEAFDSFEHAAVIGSGVRVRSAPGLQSGVLGKLGFDIIRLSSAGRQKLSAAQAKEWTAVQLRDGRTGYVASRFVRSPVGYRAFLSRKAGGPWRLTLLVAGD